MLPACSLSYSSKSNGTLIFVFAITETGALVTANNKMVLLAESHEMIN